MKIIYIPKNCSTTLTKLYPELVMHNLHNYGPLKNKPKITKIIANHVPDKYFINSPYDSQERFIASSGSMP
jgi:hypothetical protein